MTFLSPAYLCSIIFGATHVQTHSFDTRGAICTTYHRVALEQLFAAEQTSSEARANLPQDEPALAAVQLTAPAKSNTSGQSDSAPEMHARQRVSVLLGGCGDARHMLTTILDAGSDARCPDTSAPQLRCVVNDNMAEPVARAYVLLTYLHKAVTALSDAAGSQQDGIKFKTQLIKLWHVYMSPTLWTKFYEELHTVLKEVADAEQPQMDFVQCTPGTWAQVCMCSPA